MNEAPDNTLPRTIESDLLSMGPEEAKIVRLETCDPFWLLHLDSSGFGNLKGVFLQALWLGSQCVFGSDEIGGPNASDWSMKEVKNFPLVGYFLNAAQHMRACIVNKGPEPVEFRLLVKGRVYQR